jgi:hypothetical protein
MVGFGFGFSVGLFLVCVACCLWIDSPELV